VLIVVAGLVAFELAAGEASLPSFSRQACGLPRAWLERVRRGHFPGRSGDISILPRYPSYMASPAGGWTHSGPWPYLQKVPIVFYGPGVIPAGGDENRPVTTADIAPTVARLMNESLPTEDGRVLDEVVRTRKGPAEKGRPKLILTVVWDGGGWNSIGQWPEAWPNLDRLASGGVSYSNASVGSSPSVTPSVHTTLGTGVWPWIHGITAIWVRGDDDRKVDAFQGGESSRFIEVPTVAELWDEQMGNRPLVGMVGYEPWHLGMIGWGAERPGGDTDDAAWLDVETNEWITNSDHYRLPPALPATPGLGDDLKRLDAADGKVDNTWLDNTPLDDESRIEETPAFIAYHTRALEEMITAEGYGDDGVTDLLYTNYKQIDRLGHYYGMDSEEVRESVVASDRELGNLVEFLDDEVGRGEWVVIVTADHGMQPDAEDVGGYGIDPTQAKNDINAEFGPITLGVYPTDVFLDHDEMSAAGVSVAEVARFLTDYRLVDNTDEPTAGVKGAGNLEPSDRLFQLVIPSRMLPTLDCGSGSEDGGG
jgi:arylsulfatase A-like enzyme